MQITLNTIGSPRGGYSAMTPRPAPQQRGVSQDSAPTPAAAGSGRFIEANLNSIQSNSEQDLAAVPTPATSSMLTEQQITKLRYAAMAEALSRLVAMSGHIGVVLLTGVVWLFAGLGSGTAAETPTPKEYQIKAAFLYNFTRFVEWPAAKFQDTNSPIVIGVLGKNPFGEELARVVQGRKVNGRDIVVRQIETPAEARTVHVLFAAAGEHAQLGKLADALAEGCVLGVGESEAFMKDGGAILLILEGDKVRFDVDLISSERAKLKISVQLLTLARNVRKKS